MNLTRAKGGIIMNLKNIGILSAVVLVAAVVLVPGVLGAFLGFFSSSNSCLDSEFNAECTCPEGYRKVSSDWFTQERYTCEKLEDIILDPESETFETDAIEFVERYFSNHCSAFDGLNCGGVCSAENPSGCRGDYYMSAAYGWDANNRRTVMIECKHTKEWDFTQTQCGSHSDCADRTDWAFSCIEGYCAREKSGSIPWRMHFFVESPTEIPTAYEFAMGMNYYYNEDTGKSCNTQEACDYYSANGEDLSDTYCTLPMNYVPNDGLFSILSYGGSMEIPQTWHR